MNYLCEGIDKIAVAINPFFLNTGYFFSRQPRPKYISTELKGYNYPTVFIQCEALVQEANIADQIMFLLLPFLNPLIILAKPEDEDEILFIKRLSPILFSVTEMELFFDMRPDEITIVKPDMFIQCRDEERPEVVTYYTTDYGNGLDSKYRKSIADIYNRREYLIKKNQTSYEEIFTNPYFMRLEFRFVSSNFKYLNIDNLNGNYADIAEQHMDHMTMFYNRYLRDNVAINVSTYDHPNFCELLKRSDNGFTKTWCTSLKPKNITGACFSKVNKGIEVKALCEKIHPMAD
jgi:hypothetical protein